MPWRVGPRVTVIGGSLVAAAGLALATLIPSWSVALLCSRWWGPALIGFVAHATNLATALMIIAAMLLGVAASARMLRMLR